MPRIRLVTSVEASQKAVREILVTSPVVAVSCEGSGTGDKGTIYLVVVATVHEDVYAFDVRRCRDIVLDGSLIRLFQSTDVLKVIHDCASDAAALHHGFGVTLRHFFDTQVAFRIIMEQNRLPPRMISRNAIFDEFDIDVYTPSPRLQRLLHEDSHVWARRPLNTDVLNTAASHVLPLITVLFNKLSSLLKPDSSDWFDCLCDEHRLSQIQGSRRRSSSKRDTRRNTSHSASIAAIKVVHMKPPVNLAHYSDLED